MKYNSENNIDPQNFKFYKTISSEIFSDNFYNNRACIFNSFKDDNIYIVYGVSSLNLECYDLIKENKFIIIKKIHSKPFESCRHFFDETNIRDLIITSSFDSHVKIVNFMLEDSNIIIDLFFESDFGLIINTAYFINNNKIIVPFSNKDDGVIELYTMNSILIGKIDDAGFILGLSTFYWKEINKYFIIIANMEGVIAYNESDLTVYKKFIPSFEDNIIGFCESIIIEKNDNIILITPCFYKSHLFFWDFKNGCMMNKTFLESGISDICLWDNEYILVSYNESISHKFILMNTKNNKIEKKYSDNARNYFSICGIKVIRHKTKGDYIITSTMKGKLNLYKIYKQKSLSISPIYMSSICLFFILFLSYIIKKYI